MGLGLRLLVVLLGLMMDDCGVFGFVYIQWIRLDFLVVRYMLWLN